MKTIYTIVIAALLGGIIFYLISCKNNSQSNGQMNRQNENSKQIETQETYDNPYQKLRNTALATTPEQLKLELPNDKAIVYGVVMDWNLGEGIATFVAFRTGDASMYTSSGGGIIGGGLHENVKRAAISFVEKAQARLSKTTKTETTPLPSENNIKFYLLTNKGKFVAQEQMKNFENNSSDWLELFEEGNKVITQLRMASVSK